MGLISSALVSSLINSLIFFYRLVENVVVMRIAATVRCPDTPFISQGSLIWRALPVRVGMRCVFSPPCPLYVPFMSPLCPLCLL